MSDILRFDREPGQIAVAVELPEGHAVLVSETTVGSTVWPPEELGAGMRRVVAVTREKCPNTDCAMFVPHYKMSGEYQGAYLWCAECRVHTFQWGTRRK